MFKKFITYLSRLIDSKHSDDSRVFVGLLAFMYVLVVGYVNLFTGLEPSDFVFYGILGLVIGVFGLTTYLKGKSMEVKSNVASDILKEDAKESTTDAAKETLQADKP